MGPTMGDGAWAQAATTIAIDIDRSFFTTLLQRWRRKSPHCLRNEKAALAVSGGLLHRTAGTLPYRPLVVYLNTLESLRRAYVRHSAKPKWISESRDSCRATDLSHSGRPALHLAACPRPRDSSRPVGCPPNRGHQSRR